MSQHIIPGRRGYHEVLVGWDRPLGSFFAKVREGTHPNGRPQFI